MRLRAILWALAALAASNAASAHRLDQYLQATTLAVTREKVTLQVDLTPGVSVAPQILRDIGGATDGTFSVAAQRMYADRIREHLSMRADGLLLPLTLMAFYFPDPAAIRRGLGDIRLTFEVRLPPGRTSRELTFVNVNDPAVAVYLVNCLVPEDPAISIGAQGRSVDQSRYTLDIALHAPASDTARDPASGSVLGTFLYHGVLHILTGYDHLLFACALVLAVSDLWELVKVVTAFTLAHSVTLTLATLDLVHVPSQVVEPIIAASIVFVALQNVFWPGLARDGPRLAAAFLFGLFHGLGFAGGLVDLMHQLPKTSVLSAILGFSIGVELGQELVLLPVYALLAAARRAAASEGRARMLSTARRTASALIATAGTYYLAIALVSSP